MGLGRPHSDVPGLRAVLTPTGVKQRTAQHRPRGSKRQSRTRATTAEPRASHKAKHPRTAALRLALGSAPQHEVAFRQGKVGEESVGALLDERTADGPAVVLHDRRMPGSRGNIDHLAIAPTGVYVIDAKAWQGKVALRAPLLGRKKLLIAGRDRTSLIDGLDRQVAAVRAAIGDDVDDVAVRGVLCFTRAELPLLRTLTIRSHMLLYRKALSKRINQEGPLSPNAIEQIARKLAANLPPA